METVGEIMEKLIQKVLVQRGECPECGQPLYGWRTKNPDGSDRCKPTCMQCGYKALLVQEDLQTERMYNESLKARAINFFKGGSVVPNQALSFYLYCTFCFYASNHTRGEQEIMGKTNRKSRRKNAV